MKIGNSSLPVVPANQLLSAGRFMKTMFVVVSLPVIPGKTCAKINWTQDS